MIARPSWDDVWMEMAHVVARRSLCSRAQVGCVVVTKDNRVEAATYNGPSPRFDHMNQPCTEWCPRATSGALDAVYDDCPASHAESSAISRADHSELQGATVYVTGAVCYSCSKQIAQTGIARVVHVVHETDAHRDPRKVEGYLTSLGIAVTRHSDAA